MSTILPCVPMRAGISRRPFFLCEWLAADTVTRDVRIDTTMPLMVLRAASLGVSSREMPSG